MSAKKSAECINYNELNHIGIYTRNPLELPPMRFQERAEAHRPDAT